MSRNLVSNRRPLAERDATELAALIGLNARVLSEAGPANGYRLFRRSDYVPQSQEFGAQVTALEIVPGRQFGNSVIELLNAVRLAARWNLTAVHAPSVWYLKDRFRVPSSNVVVVNEPVVLERSDHLSILRGSYYNSKALAPLFRGARDLSETARMVRGGIAIWRVRSLPESELVVHIRSGDVFRRGGSHPNYGQPPLAFYAAVCRSPSWSRVHVVFQDRHNPVVGALLELLAKDGIPTVAHSGDLADDVDVLFRARSVVCGQGTLVPAVALLSQNLREVYQFESTQFSPYWPWHVTVCTVSDTRGDYRRAVLSSNWKNTEEQRRLMLEYPIDALRFVGERDSASSPGHDMQRLATGTKEREAKQFELKGSVATPIGEAESGLARLAQPDAAITIPESRLTQREARVNALYSKIDELAAAHEKLLERLDRAQRRCTLLEAAVASRDRRVASLKATFSWRITAPLRFLRRVFTRSRQERVLLPNGVGARMNRDVPAVDTSLAEE